MTDVGKAGSLRDIKVVHMHTERDAPYVAPECKDIFRYARILLWGQLILIYALYKTFWLYDLIIYFGLINKTVETDIFFIFLLLTENIN